MVSNADSDVIAAAGAEGCTITAAQLARWRQRGLIESPERARASGRGQGRPSVRYPDGTAQRVVMIGRLLASGRKLRDVPAALFMNYEIDDIHLVRRAFAECWKASQTKAQRDSGGDIEKWVTDSLRREAHRKPAGRYLIKNSGTNGVRAGSDLEQALEGLATQMTTPDGASPESLTKLVEASGIAVFFDPQSGLEITNDDIPELVASLREVTMVNMLEKVESLNDEQLRYGREVLSQVLEYVARICSKQNGLPWRINALEVFKLIPYDGETTMMSLVIAHQVSDDFESGEMSTRLHELRKVQNDFAGDHSHDILW